MNNTYKIVLLILSVTGILLTGVYSFFKWIYKVDIQDVEAQKDLKDFFQNDNSDKESIPEKDAKGEEKMKGSSDEESKDTMSKDSENNAKEKKKTNEKKKLNWSAASFEEE